MKEIKLYHTNSQINKDYYELDVEIVEANYGNGKLNGEYKEWYTNGQLFEHKHYADGKLNGEYKEWYDHGQISTHAYYVDNKLHGDYKEWHSHGQLYTQMYYVNDKLHGEHKIWNEDGRLVVHTFWVHGEEVTRQVAKLVTDINDMTEEELVMVKLAVGC